MAERQISRDEYIAKLGGTPRQVVEGMEKLQRSADAYDANLLEYRERYPRQWVVLHDGELVAHADTIDEVLAMVDEAGIPRRPGTILRFIETEDITYILRGASR